jgi:hypothetical protein
MHRPLYLVGIGYLAICGVIVLRHRAPARVATTHVTVAAGFGGSAGEWFAAMKPYCNAVEVELAQRQHPAPATLEGQGLSAACYALGGKIDHARAIISELSTQDRYRAAGIVFNVAHPVADAGDDRSAGPIMELVLEYWPNHYLARTHLESFLANYHENDGWTRNARDVLARLR